MGTYISGEPGRAFPEARANTHPAELLQQPVVLLGELAHGPGLVPVGLPQLDLLALQLALQMLDVRLQLGHAALPLPLSALQTPTQLVLLLLQVLRANQNLVKGVTLTHRMCIVTVREAGGTPTPVAMFVHVIYKTNVSVKWILTVNQEAPQGSSIVFR